MSYHGRSHYNAVVPENWNPIDSKLIKRQPGEIEHQALIMAEENPVVVQPATSQEEIARHPAASVNENDNSNSEAAAAAS